VETLLMTPGPRIDDPRYFDRLADVESRHWWSRAMWRLGSAWLDRALAGRRVLRALDVGCGAGLTALRLSRRPDIADVVGLDPSPDALRHARRRRAGGWLRGSAHALPLESGRFDVVTCLDVFQHLPPATDGQAAREIARVLAPGGVALVRANGRGFSRNRSSYRLADLSGVLSSAGLHVVYASYANCLPSLAQEVRGRLRVDRAHRSRGPHPSGAGLTIAVPPAWLNGLMGAVAGLEVVMAGRLGVSLPFGHSTLVLAEKRAV
jgi:SAM-dependent methyltransferase